MKLLYQIFQLIMVLIFAKTIISMEQDNQNQNPLANLGSLHHASANGKLRNICSLLELNADINARDSNGFTPLHYAAQNGHDHIVSFLIKQPKIKINHKTMNKVNHGRNGWTALHIAAMRGHDAVIDELLCSPDIDVNQPTPNNKQTALHMAVLYGHEYIVKILLKKMHDPNVCNKEGETALHYAIRSPNILVLKALLNDKRININKQNLSNREGYGRRTALHQAVDQEKLLMICCLLNMGALTTIKDDADCTALDIAQQNKSEEIIEIFKQYEQIPHDLWLLRGDAAKGSVEAVNKLLNTKIINFQDLNRITLLHDAVYGGHDEVVKILLQIPNININLADSQNHQTPLHYAAYYGYGEIVKDLVACSSLESNVKDKLGSTALHIAAYKGHVNVIKVLLETPGIKVNLQDNKGATPLHLGVFYFNVVECLLSKAKDIIDVNIEDDEGFTPLSLAIITSFLPIVQQILNHKGTKLNEKAKRDKMGFTPLHWALYYDKSLILNELINTQGVDINVTDNHGRTILHWAVYKEQCPFILKVPGISINAQDQDGDTALHYAVMLNSEYQLHFIEPLLCMKANIKIKNKAGLNAIELARLLAEQKRQKSEADISLRVVEILQKYEEVIDNITLNSNGEIIDEKNSNKLISISITRDDKVKFEFASDLAKIDVNAKDNKGWTRLHKSIWFNEEAEFKHLLKVPGININSEDSVNGETPLLIAIDRFGSEHLIEALINDPNININATGKIHGKTALQLAIIKRRDNIVKILLSHKDIDVNFQDPDGNTALHYAAILRNKPIIEALMHKNSNAYLLNKEGKSVLELLTPSLLYETYLLLIEQHKQNRLSYLNMLPHDLCKALARTLARY